MDKLDIFTNKLISKFNLPKSIFNYKFDDELPFIDGNNKTSDIKEIVSNVYFSSYYYLNKPSEKWNSVVLCVNLNRINEIIDFINQIILEIGEVIIDKDLALNCIHTSQIYNHFLPYEDKDDNYFAFRINFNEIIIQLCKF